MQETNDYQETQYTLCSFCEVVDCGHGYNTYMALVSIFPFGVNPELFSELKPSATSVLRGHGHLSRQLF